MFIRHKHAKHAHLTVRVLSSSATKGPHLSVDHSKTHRHSQRSLHDQLKKIGVFLSSILLITLTSLPNAYADKNNNSNTSPRWYRYYNSQGIPTLSSTISEQHLQHGYDALDKNMRLIRHFPPFSGQKYAQEQAQREQAIARRISERHLQETYISANRATLQRDRELGELDGQISRGQQQVVVLSTALNESVRAAANFERQNKQIPTYLKNQLSTNKDLLNQSQTNIAALKVKREQTSKQFNDAIATLKSIEQRGKRSISANAP